MEFVCGDMQWTRLKMILANAGRAIYVMDRFYIISTISKAIDTVLAAEAKQIKVDGYDPLLASARLVLLRRLENRSEKQGLKFTCMVQYNLHFARSPLFKEEFQ